MQDRRLEGVWWLPDAPDNKVGGTLEFTSADFQLHLIGAFTELTTVNQDLRHDVVLGASKDGKFVTLGVCDRVNSNFNSTGLLTEEYAPRIALVGCHSDDPLHEPIEQLRVTYTHLAAWVGVSGFSFEYPKSKRYKRRYRLSFEFPDELSGTVADRSVTVSHLFNTQGEDLFSHRWTQSVALKLESAPGATIQDWHDSFISPLRNLITFATLSPNAITSVQAYVRDEDDRLFPVDVLYRQADPDVPPGRAPFPSEMLFTLDDIRQDWESVLQRWFDLSDRLDSVCNLFFSVQSRPEMYTNEKFMALVQAAESYHRRRHRNYVLSQTLHHKRIAEVIAGAPNEDREWLQGKLAYSNEPSLAKRLDILVLKTWPAVGDVIRDRKSWIRCVVDTRNYLTHYDQKLQKRAASGEMLFWVSETLRILVQTCLLSDLGIDLPTISGWLTRDWKFRRLGNAPWSASTS